MKFFLLSVTVASFQVDSLSTSDELKVVCGLYLPPPSSQCHCLLSHSLVEPSSNIEGSDVINEMLCDVIPMAVLQYCPVESDMSVLSQLDQLPHYFDIC